METIKFVGVKKSLMYAALSMAENFMENYPDRKGLYDGVGYSNSLLTAYVYRVKTMIVVRASEHY